MADGKIKTIPLRGKNGEGKVAIVDAELFERLSLYKWTVTDEGYVITAEPRTNRTVSMHHMVMFSHLGVEVDHKDRDTLNNTIANLRVANKREQMLNRAAYGEIPYKGVRKNACGDAKSSLYYKHHEFRLGTYPSPEAAAVAHDAFAAYFQGRFAVLNFPDSTPIHPKIAQQLRTRRSINRGGDIYADIRRRIERIDAGKPQRKSAA